MLEQRQPRAGRPTVTSRADLERRALALFSQHGFDATTVEDIAAAAGIGRRTFFRYFASKNDVVWGDFEEHLGQLRRHLAEVVPGRPLLDSLREAILAFNSYDHDELPWHRERMALILRVPALQAHSTLRYAAWREAIADFAGRHLDLPAGALLPQVIAHSCLGAAMAAYDQWLALPDAALEPLIDEALRCLDGTWSERPT